jgi:hypothetical protein
MHFDLRAMPDHLPLDPGLDFVVHDNGMIELTEAGFRRMVQAHSAGIDTVINIDRRDVFRFPATGGASVTSVNRGRIDPARTLEKLGTAVDDECSQDNEKDNCADEWPPVVFGAARVGPPTVVARATPAFNVWVYHIRSPVLGTP